MDDRTIDLIFMGSLESLPPVSSKIVRIFTSSTFTDTTMERNTLMAKCYPRIKDYCREKHGLEFQVVDMRWGVRDEATDDHMTTELCMREIANCQRLSMGPNFVVFLGQKYGYRPIPTYILSSELQMMRDELTAMGVDGAALDLWYKKDNNAVPPISVLQPISSILVNFNNKRVPKLQAEDQAIWWDTLTKMQKLLRKAAQSLFNSGKFDKDTMHNYFMSVTEREVINGILSVKNTKNHCLAYVRYINNINLQNLKKASLFVDIINRSLDTESSKLLANLRDERLPAKIESTNMQKYTVEWIGREGLDIETHEEYLNHFIAHFYKNIVKLVDRAMRKEDSSAQGQIVTEILQHLHACNNSVKVFYGREESLERIQNYMLGDSDKPLVLYGEGGCGKTSMLAKSAALVAREWFLGKKPINIIRFLGTTPDSSTLTPTLISICQQISYNYMLPFENIPDDLVPLTAHFKQLLTYASENQPLTLYLDSVDQLCGTQDANKVSWIPTRLPPNCKIIISCANEENNPTVSQEYHVLRKMIDVDENFIEVTALGEELAMNVIKMWMKTACRDLNNYQWRLVANAISKCSLPIFVKLVFAEICRWRSYTRPQETHLASNVMDSIMMLFERIEKQHGRLLVFHALAYITAAKSGLSENELEDLISLDDKVLDDVYQYHMPPVRRIPPLLWTRIRNDLPNYLSEREADGVNVMNWYHRQFRDTAKERYFKNMNMAMYFHSMTADYYLGIWGGGNPKPFKYTEIQRHRFNLTEKEGSADRKVPVQPLVFYNKEGKVTRYNLRKFGELPFHLVRSRRFRDLYENVLFNYDWLHAKLSSCPLQAVLADFEDASVHCDDKESKRELMLVADALRLGGAILGEHPDMLAPQLIGRLLPEIGGNPNIKMLLRACDKNGIKDCALIPVNHCLHTPGGPLKYSLEGHQFAVFQFCLTSDYRYMVSISTHFITFDLSTSDLTRDVNPGIEGIMQQLVLSPDNKWAAAYSNNNQTVLLNMLSSEFVVIENPFEADENVTGVFLLNNSLFINTHLKWARFDMRGNLAKRFESPKDAEGWQLLYMEFLNQSEYFAVYWSGKIAETQLRVDSVKKTGEALPVYCHSAMVMNKKRDKMYCCTNDATYQVSIFKFENNDNNEENPHSWTYKKDLPRYDNDEKEMLLQLKLDQHDRFLLGTAGKGFVVWDLSKPGPENLSVGAMYLPLPHGVRNITTKMMQSNSIMISSKLNYAVAGVRKNLYVWDLRTKMLAKILDAHFGRIIQLEALTIGNWNSVITSSIDRSVKVWNINNIFEKVHVIDRHELPIDNISLSQLNLAATVTRSCVGIWDIRSGRLLSKLADSPLGAIVTHAEITPDGKYVISSETGKFLIWNRVSEQVIFRDDQPGIQQITFLEDGYKVMTVSVPNINTKPEAGNDDANKLTAITTVRTIPDGTIQFTFEYNIRMVEGIPFRKSVISSDESLIIVCTVDKKNHNKDGISIYDAGNGEFISRLVQCFVKNVDFLVAMPNKPHILAVISIEKCVIVDLKTKLRIRTIEKWNGNITNNGKYGLYSPTRGGLELVDIRKGSLVKTFIPRVAEGIVTVLSLFTENDEYVCYYHTSKKTIRIFRIADTAMIANYRLPAELTSIKSTKDGRSLVLGTVDGCLSVLTIADPIIEDIGAYLKDLPSRDEHFKAKLAKKKARRGFKAAVGVIKVSALLNRSRQNSVNNNNEKSEQ
ncbi:NACHT and WD repeat domain-containing protein 2 isoform X2 [Condylostylus longicornis]|uniref:NACHT and WD repeat domain-containing protein 2 isoform X2 n=1 Tax=Condylostylus longicornis TaxID=2530218 RepID=UPI00244E50B0|nr:NACHT and WD repeat domain-containing protein 2 isoform X2 [Condylostylus longicornis]XP_055384365.1 NACHT and WD repeat domain-containing protein 2 isoform X2 [Condylostylus longicornis]XP_055384366.1 NACHT and WD repeat domain-containing protein 2 isoform X2 [Condylostylus longicornis]